MPQQSPLEIPELLDRCINFVTRSELHIRLDAPDLLACSLVARSWVHPAQSQLFRAPIHTNPNLFFQPSVVQKFWAALLASPHLLQHVRLLSVDYSALPPHCLELLCRELLTRLESLMIRVENGSQTSPTPDTFPKPSTLPALRHLSLDLVGPFSLLDSIVQHFPSTIEHLDLNCTAWDSEIPSDIASTAPLIQLKSARLNMRGNDDFVWFPLHPGGSSYPFDFSQLKALAIFYAPPIDLSVIPTNRIEILDLHVMYVNPPVDLTAFPMLQILRFGIGRSTISSIVAETLSTVTSQHRIRTIIIAVERYRSGQAASYAELDSLIASMPMPSLPAVELEHSFQFHYKPDFVQYFPTLVSKNLFRVVSYDFVRECWQALVNQL
ncbi:hypothetical protein R3P38DRAFT_3593637 [Favolaschia claudopus]|uniref:F-box domain-containing protein n=1 Tax=Favolaschia claudopus TaxID=2862362 RepID=A0AAW0DLT5_9AGAR